MGSDDLIVVTGAGGLLGRAVCAELHTQGLNILPVVRKHHNGLYQDPLVMDLSQDQDLVEYCKGTVSCVIHLAAAVPHSTLYPDTEDSANLTRQIDRNVLSAVTKWDCPVVYMSTCGLYDRSSPVTKQENDIKQIKIESPYFSAKYDGEALFSIDSHAVIFRLAAPIGIGLKAGLVISRFIELARNNQALQVWGSGTREQNFIDSGDVAKIVTMAIRNPYKGVINVAGKRPTTMRDLAQKIIEVVGSGRVEFPGIQDPRDGETARYSISLAQKIYGWVPRVSLEDSFRSIVNVEFGN
jgi:nucleoside-diphosphate-sugar epimerase